MMQFKDIDQHLISVLSDFCICMESINDCIEKQMSVWFGVELSRLRYNICLYNEFGDLLMGV